MTKDPICGMSVEEATELGERVESAEIFVSHEGGGRHDFDHEPLHDGDIFKPANAHQHATASHHDDGETPQGHCGKNGCEEQCR